METSKSTRLVLIVIALGIWAIVLQNAGVIPTNQNVRVVNSIDAHVNGSVSVDNTIDVNLESINGHSNAFYDFGGNKNYVRIPVYTGY